MMPWIISIASLITTWLIGSGKRVGWLINVLLQAVWIIYAIHTRQWGFLAGCIPFGVVYAWNFVKKPDKDAGL